MANEIINSELVAKINEIVEQWNAADRPWNPANTDDSIRNGVARWAVRSIRAGIERGAMVEIGKACPVDVVTALGLDDEGQFEVIGEAVFQAYKRGAVVTAIDTIR